MDNNTKPQGVPTDLVIASFRGGLTQCQREELQAWLSEDGNRERYEALQRLWNHTINNAEGFSISKGYGRFRSRISNIWKKVAVAASVAAVAACGFLFYNLYKPSPVQPLCNYACDCLTGKSSVTLPDGSIVVLHNGASLSYDDAFSKTNREVALKGEAYFDIAKDDKNAFTIGVGDLDITVHGTTFNVSEDKESIIVSLVDGSVEVTTPEDMRCVLVPGHSAIYNKESGSLIDRKDDVDFASCWARDCLTFTQASLGEVCRYLAKWYGVDIVVPEGLKTSCSYTFTIREEPIDQIMDIMSRINPMKYLYTNDHRIIISEIH